MQMKRFDTRALYEAMNKQRLARDLSWVDVSKEIGVSATTMRNTVKGGRMEVDGMIAMVSWLGMKVEEFVRETSV